MQLAGRISRRFAMQEADRLDAISEAMVEALGAIDRYGTKPRVIYPSARKYFSTIIFIRIRKYAGEVAGRQVRERTNFES